MAGYRFIFCQPLLQKLRERAHSSLSFRGSEALPSPGTQAVKQESDEIAALGGTTRLVARRISGSPATHSPSPQPTSPTSRHSNSLRQTPPIRQHSQDQLSYQPILANWQQYPQTPEVQPYSAYPRYNSLDAQNAGPTTYPQASSTVMDSPAYFGYAGASPSSPSYTYGSDLISQEQQLAYSPFATQPSFIRTPPDYSLSLSVPDIQASWQNFISQ